VQQERVTTYLGAFFRKIAISDYLFTIITFAFLRNISVKDYAGILSLRPSF